MILNTLENLRYCRAPGMKAIKEGRGGNVPPFVSLQAWSYVRKLLGGRNYLAAGRPLLPAAAVATATPAGAD